MDKRQKKLRETSRFTKLFSISVVVASVGVFILPLLSGSNHSCPVLRQQDLEKGPNAAHAVPAFARKYNVDCTYCHTAWPQLNRTGLIFRYLGYRMPYEVPVVPEGKQPATTSPAKRAPRKLPPAISSALTQEQKIAEGKSVFERLQCVTCHINGGNLINPSKPIAGADFQKKYPDDAQIAQVIRHGVDGTAMPPYSEERLNDNQINWLIAYVRSLTPQQK